MKVNAAIVIVTMYGHIHTVKSFSTDNEGMLEAERAFLDECAYHGVGREAEVLLKNGHGEFFEGCVYLTHT